VQLSLEPRPTRQMNLKACPALVAEVDRLAAQYGASRSETTRALIRHGLAALKQLEG
jgi:metal-responsive CopG/Arc/MetJ family transcriptional regulator